MSARTQCRSAKKERAKRSYGRGEDAAASLLLTVCSTKLSKHLFTELDEYGEERGICRFSELDDRITEVLRAQRVDALQATERRARTEGMKALMQRSSSSSTNCAPS